MFVDADVIVPPTLLDEIRKVMSDPDCVGGAVDIDYRPKRLSMRIYLRGWRLLARLTGMAQGATQFCRRDVFEQVGGYDEGVWIGEDVDFYWSLKRSAKARNRKVEFIRHTRVRPSSRRFDKWPFWKTLVWTNPSSSPCYAGGRESGAAGTAGRCGRAARALTGTRIAAWPG